MTRLSLLSLLPLLLTTIALTSAQDAGYTYCKCNCNEDGCADGNAPCCGSGTCPTSGSCFPVTSTVVVSVPYPTLTNSPTTASQPPQPPISYTVASDTCPPVATGGSAPAAAIDVDLYWGPCCSGTPSNVAVASAALTTSDIAPPPEATAMSLHINSLPGDCLLNFYGSVNGWGYSPGVTYAPEKGEPGTCVLYPWYEVDDAETPSNPKGYPYVARMINVTCGEGVVKDYERSVQKKTVGKIGVLASD